MECNCLNIVHTMEINWQSAIDDHSHRKNYDEHSRMKTVSYTVHDDHNNDTDQPLR